ncbi:MAG: HprK-related kinase A [Propionivibrio sp.]
MLAEPLLFLYRDYPASLAPNGFVDFDIRLSKKRSGWFGSSVEFSWDDQTPFPALPLNQVHPLFEWGLNWCISTLAGEDIVIHAAVLERNGRALVLPGDPGSGKSTLCAELCLSGWRLLSDELTVISPASGRVKPMPRPISLKDASIRLIQSRFPGTDMTKPVEDTRKGNIAYVRPPLDAVRRWDDEVACYHVVFPQYLAAARFQASQLTKARTLSRLLDNTFNVGILGAPGFAALAQAVTNMSGHEVEYGDLSEVTEWIDSTCR